MLKINCLLITVALSFFSLFLFNSESSLVIKSINHTHDIKIDQSFNTCAISTNNSLEESIRFDKHKKQTNTNHFYTYKPLSKSHFDNSLQYLKVCDFFNLNLTIRKIVFPFHSFL